MLGGMVTTAAWLAFSGLLEVLPEAVRLTVIFPFVMLLPMRDLGILRFSMPEAKRQIPSWMLRKGSMGVFRFGFEMGTGARTYITASAPYLALLALIAVDPPPLSFLATGVGFGVGRWVTPLLRYLCRDPEAWDMTLESRNRILVGASGPLIIALAIAHFALI